MRVVEVNYKAVLTWVYGTLPYLKKTTGSLMLTTSVLVGHLWDAAPGRLLVDQACRPKASPKR